MNHVYYSILSSDEAVIRDSTLLDGYLATGIKVLAFARAEACAQIIKGREAFAQAKLLQVFEAGRNAPVITIYDGRMDGGQRENLMALAGEAPLFNGEQYLIEHFDADQNMIVEAGAGTGKTTVMIDRIMFLLHTVPDLSPEDIGMITFTNEATQHMKHKIQQELMNRFRVTGLAKYVLLLESSAGIRVQTIDAFSKDFVSEFGPSIGYGSKVSIRGFKFEKSRIIRDVLDEMYQERGMSSVQDELGLKLHNLEELIFDFWSRLSQAGLSDEEMATLDWGVPFDTESAALHNTLKRIFTNVCSRYNELKKETDAISVDDIVRELDRILSSGNELVMRAHPLKYLFVDEFQDSDNSQIRSIAWLQRHCDLNLFVVGDVKQSIYRFRGAVDTAFKKLQEALESYVPFSLVRNYRTSKDVLDSLDILFQNWEQRGMFDYGTTLQAQKKHRGRCAFHPVLNNKAVLQNECIKLIRSCLSDCISEAERNGTVHEKTQHVTVLTRTNYQLTQTAAWCRAANIPCYIQTEGSFYRSAAVLDFYTMIKAYTFPSSVQHLVDYILSPYCLDTLSADMLTNHAPGSKAQIDSLTPALESGGWSANLKKIRLKPILAVIDEIVSNADLPARYMERRRTALQNTGEWDESNLTAQVKAETMQYMANIDKLLTILRSHFSGQMADLFSLYSFLKLNIASNRSEDEPDVSGEIGCGCVYGLTVHKAKGLEFDTVIIPFTNREYRRSTDTEILLDESIKPRRAGWCSVEWRDPYHKEIGIQKRNSYYRDCVTKEFGDVDREEARLLYVAMTRSIRRLECLVIEPKAHTWADLLR